MKKGSVLGAGTESQVDPTFKGMPSSLKDIMEILPFSLAQAFSYSVKISA